MSGRAPSGSRRAISRLTCAADQRFAAVNRVVGPVTGDDPPNEADRDAVPLLEHHHLRELIAGTRIGTKPRRKEQPDDRRRSNDLDVIGLDADRKRQALQRFEVVVIDGLAHPERLCSFCGESRIGLRCDFVEKRHTRSAFGCCTWLHLTSAASGGGPRWRAPACRRRAGAMSSKEEEGP